MSFWEKVIKIYLDILIDLISNVIIERSILFFLSLYVLLFIITPFDIIIKINASKVNCFYRVIQLDYALQL